MLFSCSKKESDFMAIVQGSGGGGGTYTPPKTTLKTPQQILDEIIKQQQKVNPYLTPTQRLGTPTTPTAPKPAVPTPSTPIVPTAPAPKPSPATPTPSNTTPIVAAPTTPATNTMLPGFTTGWDSLPETTKDVNSITGAMPTGSMQTYTEPELNIQDYIKQLQDAAKSEETPHFHPDLEVLTAEEMNAPIIEESVKE